MVPTTDSYVFSDYRSIQGALMPFKVERYLSDIKAEEMQFTSVRFNASVKDDVFKP
jgi:outer membrane lipoprotein-sorting protein